MKLSNSFVLSTLTYIFYQPFSMYLTSYLSEQITEIHILFFLLFLFGGGDLDLGLNLCGGICCCDSIALGIGRSFHSLLQGIEFVSRLGTNGQKGLETVGNELWDGKSVGDISSKGKGGQEPSILLKRVSNFVQWHFDNILVQNNSLDIHILESKGVLEGNNLQKFTHLGGTFSNLFSLGDNLHLFIDFDGRFYGFALDVQLVEQIDLTDLDTSGTDWQDDVARGGDTGSGGHFDLLGLNLFSEFHVG